MTWFRIDDGFATHPKVDALGADQALAIACWTLCGTACARDLTDGLVTHAALRRTLALWSPRDQQRAVAALVRVGLWVVSDEGWCFHGWLEHQPSREDVLAERERKARNQRASRSRRRGDDPGSGQAVTGAVTGDMGSDARGDTPVSHRSPVPTRPDQREISDHTHFLETGRAPAPAPAVSARALTVTSDDDTGIGRFAQLALDQALRDAGGAYVEADGDAGFFRTVADSANACRGKRPLRETLDAWARDFVDEFRVRTTKNFALFAKTRAANGGAKVRTPSPTDRREDHTPVAGSKPDRFDAEARERDQAARRAKAEAAPMPASIAALTAGIGKLPASKATPAPIADPKPENVIEGEPPPELHDVAQALGRAAQHPIVVRGQRTTPIEIAAALPLPALRRARDTIAARQLSEMDAIEVLTGATA